MDVDSNETLQPRGNTGRRNLRRKRPASDTSGRKQPRAKRRCLVAAKRSIRRMYAANRRRRSGPYSQRRALLNRRNRANRNVAGRARRTRRVQRRSRRPANRGNVRGGLLAPMNVMRNFQGCCNFLISSLRAICELLLHPVVLTLCLLFALQFLFSMSLPFETTLQRSPPDIVCVIRNIIVFVFLYSCNPVESSSDEPHKS